MKKNLSILVLLGISGIFYATINAQTAGTSTDTTTVPPPTAVPIAPSDLRVPGTVTAYVMIQWNDNSSTEDKFNIERNANGGSFAFLAQVGTDITSYTDSSVAPGTTYGYRVQACQSGVGCSEYANLSGVSVPNAAGSGSGTVAQTEATTTNTTTTTTTTSSGGGTQSPSIPAAPTNLSIGNMTPMAVTLNWLDNATNEDKFNIERRSSTDATFMFLQQIMTANLTTYTDATAVAGSTYDYRVQACLSGFGCSSYAVLSGVHVPIAAATTANTSTTTYTTVPYATIPSVPTNFKGVPGACGTNNVALSWQAANYASYYKIFRNDMLLYSTPGLGYVDSAVSPGTSYRYALVAVNQYGYTPNVYAYVTTPPLCTGAYTATATTTSTTASTTTAATSTGVYTAPVAYTIPQAPTGLALAAAPTTNAIYLRWIDNSTNEDKWNIMRKSPTAATFSYLYQIIGQNIAYYADRTVGPGMSYDYAVQACLSGTGCSPYAYLYNVKTPAAAEAQPLIAPNQATTTDVIRNTPVPPPSTSTAPMLIQSTAAPLAPQPKISTSTALAGNDQASTTVIRFVVTANPADIATSSATSTPEVKRIETIALAIERTNAEISDARSELVRIIDASIDSALKSVDPARYSAASASLMKLRTDLIAQIDSELVGISALTPEKISSLRTKVIASLNKIPALVPQQAGTVKESTSAVTARLDMLSSAVSADSERLKAAGGDLLYKDTNKDGISDFESKAVYGIDPVKPAPVSKLEGRVLTAGEKVMLGYDPKQEELVKIAHEEPATSTAPVSKVYSVDEVKEQDKKITLTGRALPNSFVTVYLYSTPIIVTVKTNANGEWQYTLDKELESGDHTVYTATVNNSGRIVARSQQFVFTKVAEAATVPPVNATETKKLSLLGDFGVPIAVVAGGLIVLFVLILAGRKQAGKVDEGNMAV